MPGCEICVDLSYCMRLDALGIMKARKGGGEMAGYVETMRAKVGHERLIFVGAAVLLHRGRKLLLQQRHDNGCWAMHGGCVEIGEPTEAAAQRELFEETGLTANALKLFDVFSGPEGMFTYPNGDKAYIVTVTYQCDDFSGEPYADPSEVLDLKWFDIDALPENISPPDRRPITAFAAYLRETEKGQAT